LQTADGALKFVFCCGELAGPEHAEHAADLLLGVVLHMLHVGVDDVETEVRDHAA
jgi:hypothetical protein